MEKESTQTKLGHELAIAMMSKDIEYIKKGMEGVTLTLATMDRDFVRRSEVVAIGETLKKINDSLDKKATHEDFTKMALVVDSKLDRKEFEPTQKVLSRVNWILISTVVVGLLALLYKAGGN